MAQIKHLSLSAKILAIDAVLIAILALSWPSDQTRLIAVNGIVDSLSDQGRRGYHLTVIKPDNSRWTGRFSPRGLVVPRQHPLLLDAKNLPVTLGATQWGIVEEMAINAVPIIRPEQLRQDEKETARWLMIMIGLVASAALVVSAVERKFRA